MNNVGASEVWVGAWDYLDVDDITWTEKEVVFSTELWLPDQPIHTNGDCVALMADGVGLALKNCEEANYVLCKMS